MDQQEPNKKPTRREFLKTASVVAGSVAMTAAAKSSVYALAPSRVIGANDRINIGHIGVGGQGMTHVRLLKENSAANNTQSIAISDIYEPRKQAAKEFLGLDDAHVYQDYQKLLENPDVDVVWIASPEHWHYRMAMDAIHSGKDIYLEKPMTRYLDEALSLWRTVKGSDRIFQLGVQACTDQRWHVAGDAVKANRIGKIIWSQGSYCRNSKDGEWNYYTIEPQCTPQTLDWKRWLGPAPWHEFSRERYFRWRKFWDYSAGIDSDLFPHRVTPLMIGIGGAEFPERVVAVGGKWLSETDRQVPDTFHLMADFPSKQTIVVVGSTANEQGLPDEIRGHHATLYLGGNSIDLRPERDWSDQIDAVTLQVTGPGEDIAAHEKNFLDCVRSRGVPNCDVDLAVRAHAVIAMAEMSYRQSKTMLFDPVRVHLIQGKEEKPKGQVMPWHPLKESAKA